MSAVFNNGKIAVSKDLVFGLSVLVQDDSGEIDWVPLEFAKPELVVQVHNALDNNPTFPWWDELNRLRKAA